MYDMRSKYTRWLVITGVAGILATSFGCGSPDGSGDTAALITDDRDAIEIATRYLTARAGKLGIDAKALTARPSTFRDLVGGTHVWFRHSVAGARVLGSEIVVHIDRNRKVTSVTDALRRDVPMPAPARFTRDEAIKRARALVEPGDAEVQRAELVLDRTGRLAFDIELLVVDRSGPRAALSAREMLLDAVTLEHIRTWNTLETDEATLPAHGQFAGHVNVSVDRKADASFDFRDLTRGGAEVLNASGCAALSATVLDSPVYHSTSSVLGDGLPFYSVEHTFIGLSPLAPYDDVRMTPMHPDCNAVTRSRNGETAAVDLLHDHAVVYDMFERVLARSGTNGADNLLRMHAHSDIDMGPANAMWLDDCDFVAAGEQPCTLFLTFRGPNGSPDPSYPDMLARNGFTHVVGIEALDIVAHEFTHGVTHFSADLEYVDDAGGLNESFSDVFGTMAEYYALGGAFDAQGDAIPNAAPGADFLIGEDIGADTPFRSMTRPSAIQREWSRTSRDAWSRSPDFAHGDPHFTSGPGNRAFRFLAQGGSATSLETFTPLLPEGLVGIGNDLATRIWYGALPYLTAESNYIDMRGAVSRSAVDLGYALGTSVQTQIALAFDAINVGHAHLPDASRFVTHDVEPNGGVSNAALASKNNEVRIHATIDTVNFIDDVALSGTVSLADTVDLYTVYLEPGEARTISIDAPCSGAIDGKDEIVVRLRAADGTPAVKPNGFSTTDVNVIACGSLSIPVQNFAAGRGTHAGDEAVSFRSAITIAVSLASDDGRAETRPYGIRFEDVTLDAIPDAYTIDGARTSIDVPAADGVLKNDRFFPGSSAVLVNPPRIGTLTFSYTGGFRYDFNTPSFGDFSRTDAFRYRVEHGQFRSNEAEVTLTQPGRFRRVPIHAVIWRPYRYRGCPDPGPEPWRGTNVIRVLPKEEAVEITFPSEVRLDLRIEGEARGRVTVGENNQLRYSPPSGGFETDRVGIAIYDASCGVVHHTAVTFTGN